MFGIGKFGKAAVQTREDGEIPQPQVTSETAEEVQQNGNGRAWRWRVEPGMEGAFQDLLGWMLPGQQNAEIETASGPHPASAPVPAEPRPAPEPEPEPQPTGWGRKQAPAPV